MADQPLSTTPTEAAPITNQAWSLSSTGDTPTTDQPRLVMPTETTAIIPQTSLNMPADYIPFRLLDLPNAGDSMLISKIINTYCADRHIRIRPESQKEGIDLHGCHCRDPYFLCIRLVNHLICEESTRAIFQNSTFHTSLHSLDFYGRISSVENSLDSPLGAGSVIIPSLYTSGIRKLVIRRVELGQRLISEGAALLSLCTIMTSLRELYVDTNAYFACFRQDDGNVTPARRALVEMVQSIQNVDPQVVRVSLRFRGQTQNSLQSYRHITQDIVMVVNNDSQVFVRRSSRNLTLSTLRNFLRLLELPLDVAVHDVSVYDNHDIEKLGIWPQVPENLRLVDRVGGVDWSE